MLLHTNDLSAVAPLSEWRASERSMTRGTRYAALRRIRPRSGARPPPLHGHRALKRLIV